MTASYVLLGILLGGSACVWYRWVSLFRKGESPFTMNQQPRATWNSAPELTVVYVALLWLGCHLLMQFSSPQPPNASSSPDASSLLEGTALNFGLALILPLAIVSTRRTWSQFGLTTSGLRDQVMVGVEAYLAAALPMTISILVTSWFRGPETQHSLLISLAKSPDVVTVLLIFVLAAISAPLLEEMLFRVILQGWLATIFPAPVAITVVAILFSLVHGWKNGIALLPLALILGYVFHRRHSYIAVIVIHALFNATMILLAASEAEKAVLNRGTTQ